MKLIIWKETHENITSYRNLITTGMCIILFLSSALIMTRDYRNRQVNYSLRDAMGQTRTGIRPKIAKPPTSLSVLARGLDANMGRLIFIWWSQPRKEVGADVVDPGERNPLFSLFAAPDFVYIVKIIMSILALFFAFDSICGEKERGTLRMMLACGGTNRSSVIIGKWLGGYLSFLLCFLPALLLILIWIVLSPAMNIKGEDWVRIGFMILFSLAYISIFFLLGLFVSTLTHRGSTSLLIILLLWVVWVIGLPNLGVLLAKRLSPVPESLAFMSEKAAIGQQRFDSQMDSFEAYWRADDRYIAKVNQQADLVRKLTRISPMASYVYITTALARTGVAESQRYKRAVIDWDRDIRRMADRQMREYKRRMEEYNSQIKSGAHSDGMPAPPERPKSAYDWAEEVPFNYKERRLSEVFQNIWIDIFLMLGFNVILFMASYLSFLRYDVR
jgi:ABC-type transport system involved in multi-copper enzyme maturation permease subunit